METGQVLQLDVQVLTFILGTLIPLLTGLLTKADASPRVKAFVMLALDVAAGGIAVAIEADGQVVLQTWVMGMAFAFISSGAMYRHVWKPFGVSDALNAATAQFGIGKPKVDLAA